jgi:uncharacterized membrane protein YeiB
MLPRDLFAAFEARIVVYPIIALLGPLGFACPFLMGVWAGRRRILEQPDKNVTLLKWTAILGIGGTIAGALPVSLVLAGITAKPNADTLNELGVLHDASGVLGGFGYAAVIVLIALRLGREPGPITRAVSAVGQRSLTCYLIQSVMWTLVFTPYLTDLSDELTVTTTAVLALVVCLALHGLPRRLDGPLVVPRSVRAADPPVHLQGIHQLDRCIGARGKLCGWLSTAASVASAHHLNPSPP